MWGAGQFAEDASHRGAVRVLLRWGYWLVWTFT